MDKIVGFEKLSLKDYPGKLSTIHFTSGCQLRCPYCHNPNLVLPNLIKDQQNFQNNENFLTYLEKRKNLLEAVVFTGGEALLNPELEKLINVVKSFGLLVKLDTNGQMPEKLERLLAKGLIDYLAIDYKGSRKSYDLAIGITNNNKEARKAYQNWKKSLVLAVSYYVKFELRTTLVKEIHSIEDIILMADELKEIIGLQEIPWYLQTFEKRGSILQDFVEDKKELSAYSKEEMIDIKNTIKKIINKVKIRY